MVLKEFLINIGFNVDEAGLSRAQSRVDAFALRMGRIGNQLTWALSAPIAGLAAYAIKSASMVEQSEVAFDVFIGNAQKSKAVFKDLVDFTVKTPFRFPGVVQAANMLLAMGESADTLVETMGVLGHVSRGRQDLLQRVSLAYGQIMTAGRLKGQELRQLTEAGVGILPELRKLTGYSEAALSTPGKLNIPASVVRQALVNMASEGGRYYGLLERQMQTIGGLFSNLADSVFFLSAEFGKHIVQILKLHVIIPKFTAFLMKLLKHFTELDESQKKLVFGLGLFLAAIGPLLVAFSTLIKLGSFVVTTFRMIALAAIQAEGGVLAFMGQVILIPLAILAAIGAIVLLIDEINVWMKGGETYLGDWLGPYANYSAGVTNFLNKLKGYYDQAKQDLNTVKDYIIVEFIPPIKDAFQGLSDFLAGIWQDDQNKMTEGFKRLLPAIWKMYSAFINGIAFFVIESFNRVMDFLVDAILLLGDKIGNLFSWVLTRGIGAILDSIGNVIKQALGISKSAKTGKYLGDAGDAFLTNDMENFNKMTSALKATGKAAWNNLFSPLDKGNESYLALQEQISTLKGAVSGSASDLKKGIGDINLSDLPYGIRNLAGGGPALTPKGIDWINIPRTVEINNDIKVEVPYGTKREQANFLKDAMEQIATDSLNRAADAILVKNKGVQ